MKLSTFSAISTFGRLYRNSKTWSLEIQGVSVNHYLFLLFIIILAAVLRFYKLGDWSFWIDEIYTINRALTTFSDSSLKIPLSTRLTGVSLTVFSVNEWSARFIPALFGIVSIPILFLPIKKIFGSRVALLSVAILAISPWQIYWSQNARLYTAFMLFYSLSMLCFYIWFETDRFPYLIISGLMFYFAFIERSITLFIAPAIGIYILSIILFRSEKPLGFRWRNLILLSIPAFIIALRILPDQINIVSTTHFGYSFNPIRVLFSVIYDIGIPLFLLAILGGIHLIQQNKRLGLYFSLHATVPLALLLLLSPFTLTNSRYVFATLPIWAILGAIAGLGIYDIVKKNHLILAFGVILIFTSDAVSHNFLYYFHQNGNRENWKSAYGLVQSRKKEGDIVITTRPEIGRYYLQETIVTSHDKKPEEIIEMGERVWFVIDNRSGGLTPSLRNWILDNAKIEGVFDVQIPGKLFLMRVLLYEP
jgi:mannosyltransferase